MDPRFPQTNQTKVRRGAGVGWEDPAGSVGR